MPPRVGPAELLLLVAVLLAIVLFLSWARRVARRGAVRYEQERRDAERARLVEDLRAARPAERTTREVIERQVLVTRCRFCQKLTPVDLSACAECGSKL